MSKYLTICLSITAIIVLAIIYFLGKSAGYDSGYITGKAEVQVELDRLSSQYNEVVKSSNAKISQLEQQAFLASQEKDKLVSEYKKRLETLTVQDQSRAWSEETVRAINEVLK